MGNRKGKQTLNDVDCQRARQKKQNSKQQGKRKKLIAWREILLVKNTDQGGRKGEQKRREGLLLVSPNPNCPPKC